MEIRRIGVVSRHPADPARIGEGDTAELGRSGLESNSV
jgi:hypothetical protein